MNSVALRKVFAFLRAKADDATVRYSTHPPSGLSAMALHA